MKSSNYNKSSIKAPKYLESRGYSPPSKLISEFSQSRSKSRKKPYVSNKPDVQVVRDDKGFKRRIEYPDDSSSPETGTAARRT